MKGFKSLVGAQRGSDPNGTRTLPELDSRSSTPGARLPELDTRNGGVQRCRGIVACIGDEPGEIVLDMAPAPCYSAPRVALTFTAR